MDKQSRVCYHNSGDKNMAEFKIVIDNGTVFYDGQIDAQATVLPIGFTIAGKTLEKIDAETVRAAHLDGQKVHTQITPKDSTLALEKLLNDGYDVLLLSISSSISESFKTAEYIAKGLKIKHPDREIVVIDTLSCGAGEALMLATALKLQKQGLSINEVAKELEESKRFLHQVFIVDETDFLVRSGVISPTAIVNIKPIFDFANSGRLLVLQKAMGRKKALSDMLKYVSKTFDEARCKTLVITYGAEADARALGESIQRQFPTANVKYAQENEHLSAYLGESSVSICFFGEQRKS